MQGFKEFIMESANNYPWGSFEKIADYIKPGKNRDGSVSQTNRARDRYLEAIHKFKSAIEAKEIYNADFKDLYTYGLARGLEDAWESISLGYSSWDEYTLFAVNSIAKLIRLANKNNAPKEAKEFLSLAEKIPDMVKELKTYIKMGRKPNVAKEAAKAKFNAIVSLPAAKTVIDLLNKTVTDIRTEYEKQYTANDQKLIEKVMASKDKIVSGIRAERAKNKFANVPHEDTWWNYYGNTHLSLIMQKIVNFKTGDLESNWKSTVEKLAKDDVKQILDGFVAKNTKKLAAIVEKKGNLKNAKIIHNRVHQGNLDNEMFFEFEDGAQFTVYSQTIYKYSNRGKLFTQYPTRFTNVKLSNGTMMKAPNEEKMNTEFK